VNGSVSIWGDKNSVELDHCASLRNGNGVTSPATRERGETVWQLLCRPSGTQLCTACLPGTYVPDSPVSPLRGWRNGAVHFFAALGVATQTRGAPEAHGD
jgi:hypothetical protein